MSGIDITATFDNVPIGTLQGISYSVTREKSPVYTFGSANPRSFSRGKRGLAGSMIFTLFDRSAMYNIVHDNAHNYYAHAHEPLNTFDPRMAEDVFSLYKNFQSVGIDATTGQATGAATTTNAAALSAGGGVNNTPTSAGTAAANNLATSTGNANYGVSTVKVPAEYSDQIMPFDITLIAQNEYGLAAFMVIIGVEILNEGGGLTKLTNLHLYDIIAATNISGNNNGWIQRSGETESNCERELSEIYKASWESSELQRAA